VIFLRHVGLALVAFFLLMTSVSSAGVYVTHTTEFKHHIELHRQRVLRLGLLLAEAQFPEIPRSELKSFLSIHDSSKTMANSSERLYQFYGKPPTTAVEREALGRIVTDINVIDTRMAQEFYTIEKIADLVDRSLDPVAAEEFGRAMTPASQFLKDPEMARLSLWLESHYENTISDLRMPKSRACQGVFH